MKHPGKLEVTNNGQRAKSTNHYTTRRAIA